MEVYDLSPDASSILGNISTRGFVQTGDDVMIGGFMVAGTQPKRVIVRAIGPELTQYGVPNALVNPTLELHDGTGALIASNDNWHDDNHRRDYHQQPGARHPNQRLRTRVTEGNQQSSQSCQPGNYTAIVRGVNNTTGVALVEVYDLDQ